MKWVLAMICVLFAGSNASGAPYEFALMSTGSSGVTWADKTGERTTSCADFTGDNVKIANPNQARVLVLNTASRKGWEIVHVTDTGGVQTYLLKHESTGDSTANAEGDTRVDVIFTGGFDTDPQDHARPVILVASGLKVPPEVFRKAFSNVKPAGRGEQPEDSQVRKNKQALMETLQPYGVTNDRLDEVSNYYRYSGSRGQMWKHTPAAAYATVRNGQVIAVTITNAGAGYSSAPKVSIAGNDATAVLSFGTDLTSNGSVKEIKINAKQ